ncbi:MULTISPECIES: hypothetical protein [Streptomyces]|jgi:hypothetical protein|uniref:Uncharacterized protein n=1 Tax=Streptomyces werraensis TaxID=68284 RepID=A0ABV3JB91_9ACTN|nr:hypothetical protein [Streptomyces werraensis]GHF25893.1 hypothetical protein GCM10018789_64650 [Streptomyces werraensis]
MAEGDGVADQDICIRLDGSATEGDVTALRSWLERERPLDDLLRDGRLRLFERPAADRGGAPMGTSQEIVIAVTSAGATVVFQELLEQVKRGVTAWRDNRREVENGEPPQGRVEPVNRDDR